VKWYGEEVKVEEEEVEEDNTAQDKRLYYR